MVEGDYHANYVQERENALRVEAEQARNGEPIAHMWDIHEFAAPLMEDGERSRLKRLLQPHHATLESGQNTITVKLPAGTKSTHAIMTGNIPRSVVIFPEGFLIQLEMLPARQWVYRVGFPKEGSYINPEQKETVEQRDCH